MLKTILFLILTLLSITTIPNTQVYAAASIGRIVHTDGPAWVQRGTTREKAEKGQIVLRNDAIITGSRGRVKIIMSDGSKVYIGSKSRVSLRKYSLRGTNLLNARINMLWGKARFFVNKLSGKDSSFRVRTPTAVLGVRGTEFIVLVPPTPKVLELAFEDIRLADVPQLPTRAILSEGAIDVSTGRTDAMERLLPGHTASIDKGGNITIKKTEKDDTTWQNRNGSSKGAHPTSSNRPNQTANDDIKNTPKPQPLKHLEQLSNTLPQNLDKPLLDEIPQDAINALQNMENTTKIIIQPSFVEPPANSPTNNVLQ